jgi:hypothetical protein
MNEERDTVDAVDRRCDATHFVARGEIFLRYVYRYRKACYHSETLHAKWRSVGEKADRQMSNQADVDNYESLQCHVEFVRLRSLHVG